MGLIGIDEMIVELGRHGIKVESKYDRGRDLYTIIAKKGDWWVSRKFRPFDINVSHEIFNTERRGVINSIIEAFEKKRIRCYLQNC